MSHEARKNGFQGFRTGPTQTGLYSHRKVTEALNFRFKKKRGFTICVVKTKALISFAVAAKLICTFLFALANIWFSHDTAYICHVKGLFSIFESS